MPLVSVIVPVYNREKTIERCLKAIRVSEYKNYELIVIDDGSQDTTYSIANNYSDRVIKHPKNIGLFSAYNSGIKASQGDIIVKIDSDIVIKEDTLGKIVRYLGLCDEVDAATGILSKEHDNPDFFSQYKNLYMHYIFKKLPERVSFLYGSIYAVRRRVIGLHDFNIAQTNRYHDTAFGQKLASCGRQIAFLKDLEVMHLKKYDLLTFVGNDFQVPFHWAQIFLKFKGWKQLFKNKTGFAHSPKEQLLSVLLALVLLLSLPIMLFYHHFMPFVFSFILAWFIFNTHFIIFLVKEKGLVFGIVAIFITFLDNIIMALGILCGFLTFLFIKHPASSYKEI
jgi:glycosyltransferase involved in cell wall biosynthesis